MINVLRGYARSFATNHGELCMATDNGAHVVSLPTMVGFVRLLIMKNARSFVTNNAGLCKTADNKGKGQ